MLTCLLGGQAIFGEAALTPESNLDRILPYKDPPLPRQVFFSDPTPFWIDYPRDLAFARGIHAGRLDLWNPASSCGAPLWAEQGEPFFPLRLPFYVFPAPVTYDLFLLLRLVALGWGTFLFCRARGLSPIGAWLSGAFLELSGVAVAQLAFGSVSAICMLPWLLLTTHLLEGRSSAWKVALAGVVIGIAGSCGHPTVTFTVFLGFATYFIARCASLRKIHQSIGLASRGALACTLGFMLMAPTVLPRIELLQHGASYKHINRARAVWFYDRAHMRSVLPLALYNPAAFDSLPERKPAVWPWGFSPSAPALVYFLALSGLLLRYQPDLGALLVLGIGLAMSPLAPLWDVPGAYWVLPRYAWILIALPISCAAGLALEAYGTGSSRIMSRIRLVLAFAAVAIGSASVLTLKGDAWIANRDHLHSLVVNLAVMAVGAGALWASLGSRYARAVQLAVGIAATVQAFLIATQFVYYQRAESLRHPAPQVEWLRRRLAEGSARIHAPNFYVATPRTASLFGMPDVRGIAALPIERYKKYIGAIPEADVGFTKQTANTLSSPLLDLAAARYVLVGRMSPWRKALAEDDTFRILNHGPTTVVAENTGALVRARAVYRAAVAADAEAVGRQLEEIARHATHASGTRLTGSVFLERDTLTEAPLPAGVPASELEPSDVQIVRNEDPDVVILQAQLAAPGFVVLADSFYPGWRATIDGKETTIYPANLAFRAVYSPAGRHRIELSYQPSSFRAGTGLFWIGAAIICATGLAKAARRARL